MISDSAVRRSSRVLQEALDELVDSGAATDVDIEPLARTVAFATSLVRTPFEPMSAGIRAQRIPYTIAASSLLAHQVRSRLCDDDIQPILDLPDQLTRHFGTVTFPIESSEIASAGVMIDRMAFLFVSTKLAHNKLSECARVFAKVVAAASRSDMEDTAFVATFPACRTAGPRETLATNFAGYLLVPTRGLAITLKKVREILNVQKAEVGDIELLYTSRIFGVSFEDLARRCEREGLLPPGGTRIMERFLAERFGGPEARATNLALPVRPQIEIHSIPNALMSILAEQVEAGRMSSDEVAYWLNLTPAKVDSLLFSQDDSKGLRQ